MFERDVRSPEQALAYITDCTLATVACMAMKKSRAKGEFQRQISIAQKAIDWMDQMGVSMKDTRAENVMSGGGSVDHWAKQFIDDSPRGK
jgi:thiamine biosynthesis protein ThiC